MRKTNTGAGECVEAGVMRSRARRTGWAAAAAVGLGALLWAGPLATHAQRTAVAAAGFTCGALYSVQGAGANPGARAIWSVDPATGAGTPVAAFGGVTGTINALGITAGGTAAYGVAANGTARTIHRFDTATGTTTSAPGVADAPVTHGAVNPRNGFYYYGGFVGTTLKVYGHDPRTGTSLGLVAQGATPTDGANGDWAFDQQGRLYVVGGAGGTNSVFVVNEEIPTTAGPARAITGRRITTISTPGQALNGIAFAGDGYLYPASGTTLYRANPSTGEVLGSRALSQAGSVDFGSCASPNTIVVRKDFPLGRVTPSDQATVTVTGGGITTGNTGTTRGSDVGLQTEPGEMAGPVFGLAGSTYTVSESGSGTSESGPTAPGYERGWECVNQNNGQVLARGTGTSGQFTMPDGGAAGVAALCTFTNTARVSRIDLTKEAGAIADADGNGPDAGDAIPYTFTVANTGTVVLETIRVDDPKVGPVTCPPGPLAIGASTTCTATYRLTQADVDGGSVPNTATATGTATNLPDATDEDSVTTPVPVTSAISLVKAAAGVADVDANGPDAGDTITYAFTVTNTGNVTLTGVAVDDPRVGPVTCPSTTLAPGASTTCTAPPYPLTQADVDAGAVDNTATATGVPPTGDPVTSSDHTTTPVEVVAGLDLDKRATLADADGNGRADAGERVDYSFVVTNTGSVTITDPTIVDDRLAAAGVAVTCPTGPLPPGGSTTCAATYVVTRDDVTAGAIVNTATATGRTPGGGAVDSPPDTATVPSGALPTTTPPEPQPEPQPTRPGTPPHPERPHDELPSTGVNVALAALSGLAAVALGLLALRAGKPRRER
ncbi:DUF7507 domain-containing protein [Actinosynnema sp. NPDC004786]